MTRTLQICIHLLSVVAFLRVPMLQAWASPADVGASMPPLAETASWPMLAANPQRTSWTQEEVRGNLSVDWYRPIEPYIPYKVQPIAANGAIYVSSARGLYAFRASDGGLLWVYPTEMPLGHSPTIATVSGKSVAYVGGYDHKIHAMDAISGQALPGYVAYEAQAGFETNPLVIQDSYTNNAPTIFAGNRDGYFYALDAITGALKWKFQTQGPILFSAAYKNGILYFASNDNNAYALTTKGGLVWKAGGFPGQGFHSFWPVIYAHKGTGKDYVVFAAGENYRGSELFLQTSESPLGETAILFNESNDPGPVPVGSTVDYPSGNGAVSGDWAAGTVTMDAHRITNYLEKYPYRHFVFVLDAANGQEFTFDSDNDGKVEYAPFVWAGITSSGSKYPPVVNGIDGVYYQATAYYSGGWVSRSGPAGWKFGTSIISRVDAGNGPGAGNGHATDEPMAYSSGGRLIYWVLCCDREAGAYDVTIPFGQANRDWYYWGYSLGNLAPDYRMMYNDGDPTLYNNNDGWQVYSGKSHSKNGMYSNHGTTQSPPIPYQGKVYFLRGNALLAFSPTGSNPKTPLPLATIVSASGTFSPPSKADLAARLEVEVQKMLAAGHLRPGYHGAGFVDIVGIGTRGDEFELGEIFDYFENPSDTVVTLIQTLPYLSSGLQQQVKTYLQQNYGPGATYDFTEIAHVGWGTGAQREVFTTPPETTDRNNNGSAWGQPYRPPMAPSTRPTCGGDPANGYACGYWFWFPPYNFYAAWKYAEIFGGAKTIFDSMKDKIEGFPGSNDPRYQNFIDKPYFIHLYAAGYKGYLELQKLADPSGTPDARVQNWYNQALSLRVSTFSKDTPFWKSYWIANVNMGRTLSAARNFMFLTPEVAADMRQNLRTRVEEAIDEYNYVAPYWFVSKFDDTYGEGTLQPLYDPPSLFQAKAYILQEAYTDLVQWLDVPAFARGDLFYIQNLVAALQAPSDGRVPIFADVPITHPYNGEIETLYQAGYTAGCGTDPLRYCPEATMNRAESSVFVERGIHTASYEPPAPTTQAFADVTLDSWAAKWVNGLWQDQYTAGCGTNPLVYCPWQGHTRAEGCVFYLRMLRGATYEPPQPTQQTFADVPLDAWYARWVQAAYDAGLLKACETSPALRFCPEDPLTRALAAYMMVQAKGLR